jgi:hypothetical protein
VSSDLFSIGFGADEITFSLARIREANFLAPVVFDNSKITKMHDSLPLQLFSPVTFSWILKHPGPELVLTPWCLLTAALTIPDFNTKTRRDFLEIGFWFQLIYERLLTQIGPPHGVGQKVSPVNYARLYTNEQLRDSLNDFASLLSIIRDSLTPISLNRLGSDPLEHSFGQARIRCRDVNTMNKMLTAFADKAHLISKLPFLELLDTPSRRHSLGVVCGPWAESPPSVLMHTPFLIALSLFEQIGIGISRSFPDPLAASEPEDVSEAPRPAAAPLPPAWHELLKIPAFSSPLTCGALNGTVFLSFFGHSAGQAGEEEAVRHIS